MEKERKVVVNSGLSFEGLLTIVFIVLKLLGKIDWSWFWVLSPIWIPICLAILIMLIFIAVAAVMSNI